MEMIIQGIIDGALALGQALAALPEQDRQKVIDDLKRQFLGLHTDTKALADELDALKAEHADLKKQLAAFGSP